MQTDIHCIDREIDREMGRWKERWVDIKTDGYGPDGGCRVNGKWDLGSTVKCHVKLLGSREQ